MIRNRVIILLLTALAVLSCKHERVLPDLDPDDPETPVQPASRYTTGQSFKSTLLGTSIPYNILIPEHYATEDAIYPVVYCFHGYNNDHNSWNGDSMRIQTEIESLERSGKIPPMIYVFPMGYNSYFVNRWNGSYPYMDMFVNEFVPWIDRMYRTIADKEHRAVVGYSMGAFGALATAMQHPETFSTCAALSISMRTDEQYMTESQGAFDNQWGRIFGGEGNTGASRITEYYKSLCPLHQFTTDNIDKYSGVNYFITCGDNEKTLLYGNDDLHVMMLQNGYDHEYRVGDGGHSESYWRPAMREVLPWFKFLMDGRTDWEFNTYTIDVPEDCTFGENGEFLSQSYINAGMTQGTALYLFHKGLDDAVVRDAEAIMQRSNNKKYVILPCDVTLKSPSEWVTQWEAAYTVTARQAIALGEAGPALIQDQGTFTYLYFENAKIEGTFSVSSSKKYFIGQCDQNEYSAGANALYKACKEGGVDFEYRCRNHVNDAREDLLMGIEYIKANLKGL